MNDRFKYRYVYKNKIYDVAAMELDRGVVYFKEDGVPDIVEYDNLLQCTGLKDRNGTLIYEGDIVEVIPEEDNAVIEWDNDTARFEVYLKNQKVRANFDNYYGYELEVIGNIHENPELIKTQNINKTI